MKIFLLIISILVVVLFGLGGWLYNYFQIQKAKKIGISVPTEAWNGMLLKNALLPLIGIGYIVYYFFGW